jgi:hypothetical protein
MRVNFGEFWGKGKTIRKVAETIYLFPQLLSHLDAAVASEKLLS